MIEVMLKNLKDRPLNLVNKDKKIQNSKKCVLTSKENPSEQNPDTMYHRCIMQKKASLPQKWSTLQSVKIKEGKGFLILFKPNILVKIMVQQYQNLLLPNLYVMRLPEDERLSPQISITLRLNP